MVFDVLGSGFEDFRFAILFVDRGNAGDDQKRKR